MVYTNESVIRGQRSGLGTTARPRNEVSVEKSDAYQIKTSSMRMEMRLQSRISNTPVTRVIIVSDSQSMLQGVQNGSYCLAATFSILVLYVVDLYSPL